MKKATTYKDDRVNGIYEQRKRLPQYWFNKASDLRGAAGALWASMDYERSNAIVKTLGLGSGYRMDAALRSVYWMLCGMSLELIFKAIAVAQGNEVKPVHKLACLAELAGVDFDDNDKALLGILSQSIEWRGRYPVPKPKNLSDMERSNRLINEHLSDEVSSNNVKVRRQNSALDWPSFNRLWDTANKIFWTYHSEY